MKNIQKRKDGRWQYSKMVENNRIYIYAKTKQELLKKIKESKPKRQYHKNPKYSFVNLANEWYLMYKQNITSSKNYKTCINKYLSSEIFNKDINKITYQELQTTLLDIKATKMSEYCYFIITGVFKEALKREIITKDISQFVTKPKHEVNKGSAFTIKEQSIILNNINKCPIKNEVLFYILTGCRRTEATTIKYEDIDFEHNTILIRGTKTKNSKRYIKISKTYSNFLKNNFNNMFKEQKDYYTHKFKEYLNNLNIKNKTLHDLRHTFSTNLYYLGVPDKERQSYMGHASIVMTNDIYTTLEPNVTKQDILNLYKDLYPTF